MAGGERSHGRWGRKLGSSELQPPDAVYPVRSRSVEWAGSSSGRWQRQRWSSNGVRERNKQQEDWDWLLEGRICVTWSFTCGFSLFFLPVSLRWNWHSTVGVWSVQHDSTHTPRTDGCNKFSEHPSSHTDRKWNTIEKNVFLERIQPESVHFFVKLKFFIRSYFVHDFQTEIKLHVFKKNKIVVSKRVSTLRLLSIYSSNHFDVWHPAVFTVLSCCTSHS